MLWYTVNKTDLVRLVIVHDPDHVEPADYFLTTDTDATAAQVATRYATRGTIEVSSRDVVQHLGGHNPQSWKRRGPERATALSLWLHALIWCWYLQTQPHRANLDPPTLVPHEEHSELPRRPRTLRHMLWTHRITTMSRPGAEEPKITEALLDTLAYPAQTQTRA